MIIKIDIRNFRERARTVCGLLRILNASLWYGEISVVIPGAERTRPQPDGDPEEAGGEESVYHVWKR